MEVLFYIIGLVFNIGLDGFLWGRKRYIDLKGHRVRFFLRFVFFSVLAVSYWDYSPAIHASAALIPYMLIQAAVWWLVFDPLVNLAAGQRIFHLGRTSLFDAVFWWIGKEYQQAVMLQYICKVSSLVLALWLNTPSGFDWFMALARDFYSNQF